MPQPCRIALAAAALALAGCASAPPQTHNAAAPQGHTQGSAWQHTPASLAAAMQRAAVALPAQATGGAIYSGPLAQAPAGVARVPVVVFLHGSSGLGLKAIGQWQHWLATQGIASIAPDSFALPERLTYKSPVDKAVYERIHALRGSEIAPAIAALRSTAWADMQRLALAGTSEGAVAVARYAGHEFVARLVFAWSCESNYFVQQPGNAFEADKPVLNVISSADPYYSHTNAWLGNPQAKGSCVDALKDNKQAVVALIPGAPHTLLMLPQVQAITAGFLHNVLGPQTTP